MDLKIAVVGSLDVISIFKTIGLDAFEVTDKNSTIQTLNSLINDYKIILITDDFAPFIEELIKETSKNMFPIITIIPSGTKESDYALKKIEESVDHTLVINILSQKKEQD